MVVLQPSGHGPGLKALSLAQISGLVSVLNLVFRAPTPLRSRARTNSVKLIKTLGEELRVRSAAHLGHAGKL